MEQFKISLGMSHILPPVELGWRRLLLALIQRQLGSDKADREFAGAQEYIKGYRLEHLDITRLRREAVVVFATKAKPKT